MTGYQLLDSGGQKKLESFAGKKVIRPCSQAIWQPTCTNIWKNDTLTFTREKGWSGCKKNWSVKVEGVTLLLEPTDFGHLGFFPEHVQLWQELPDIAAKNVLNLFAYTGAFSIYAAKLGGCVTHVDASKPAMLWAKKNAATNGVTTIRWICEDVFRFLKRLQRRKERFQVIILDPPSFGRGTKGEVFQIEKDLNQLLSLVVSLLEKNGLGILSCHTPGYTPLMLEQTIRQHKICQITGKELFLHGANGLKIPAGSVALWKR